MLLSFAIAANAQARSCAGVRVPETVAVDGKTLQLNGVGLREATFLQVDVFVAALYVERKSNKAKVLLHTDQRVQMVFHFVRATSAAQIEGDLETGLQDNAPNASATYKRQLFGWLADLEVGDTMTFTYVPGKGLELKIRNRVKGTIASLDFARAVLSIMIGPRPQSEQLRAALLGGPCEE